MTNSWFVSLLVSLSRLPPSVLLPSPSLQVVLCFSPVGFTLRTRARKFPALVNCTAIDWFHSWPQLALQSVSTTFIEKIPDLEVNTSLKTSQSHRQWMIIMENSHLFAYPCFLSNLSSRMSVRPSVSLSPTPILVLTR